MMMQLKGLTMKILHLHELAEFLKDSSITQVQRDTGLSRPTLTAVRDMSKPRFYLDTVITLSKYFQEKTNAE